MRTHANCAPGFIERLRRDADKQFRVGNLLFEDIRSMQDIRRSFQLDDMNDFRNQLWGIGFLLLRVTSYNVCYTKLLRSDYNYRRLRTI